MTINNSSSLKNRDCLLLRIHTRAALRVVLAKVPLPLVLLVLVALALQKSIAISDFVFCTNLQKAKDHKTYPIIIVILLGQKLAVDLVFRLVSFGAAVVARVFLVLVAALALQKSNAISDFENSVSYPI